ncbi:MAG: TMEM175 family protein [Bacteroidetes bacterium]|nr:TMEM175 family protein [Bacteroidota bacterium]
MRNPNTRLEAFCDGVFAIALTLLIIEIKVPSIEYIHSKKELIDAFVHQWPSWGAFLMSFITIFISWNNHAHAFKLIEKTSPHFIFANGLLLLSVAILPFPTAAVAEYIQTDYAQPAVTFYCGISVLNNISWLLLGIASRPLYKSSVKKHLFDKNMQAVMMGTALYCFTFALSFWLPITAFIIIALSFIAWLILGITIPGMMEEEEVKA